MAVRQICACFVLLGSVGVASAADAPVHDPLWKAALDKAAENRTWRPRRILEDERLIHPKGGMFDRRTESVHETYRDEEGRWWARLVSAVRGGKDVSEARRKELEKRPKREFFKPENDVFGPLWNASNTATRTQLRHEFEGRPAVGFLYTMEARDATWVGVVFVDAVSGVPRLITVVPDRFPVQENVTIRNMTLEFYFKEDGERRSLDRMEIRSNIEAKMSALFTWKGRSEVSLKFEDWYELKD